MSSTRFAIVNIGTLSMNPFWGETDRMRTPTATCTLLEAGGKLVLVDPSPEPDTLQDLLFARAGLRPDAVDQVFITHFHDDHASGLSLFADKQWLMAEEAIDEWIERAPKDAQSAYHFLPAEQHLPDGVGLFPSPGHTLAHHSLVADTKWGRLIIAGDGVMTEEFFEAEEGYHNSADFDLAAESIRRMKAEADVVIPGHGNLFLVDRA